MRDVENLRRADQFRRFEFVAAELLDSALDGVAVLRVLVLDDAHRHAVDDEHDVGPIALARGRLQRPFPRDVKDVGLHILEVDELYVPMAFVRLVVPAVLTAQPCQHLAVAFDGRRDRVERLDDRARRVGREPRVEFQQLRFEFVAQQHAGLAAALLLGDLRCERRPADLGGVLHHRELHGPGLGDGELRQSP